MNTSKQVNVMIGLMFIFLVGTLLYFVWDDVRAEAGPGKDRERRHERVFFNTKTIFWASYEYGA